MDRLLNKKFILTNKETGNKMIFKFQENKMYSKEYKIESVLLHSEGKDITQDDECMVSDIWYTDDAVSFIKNNDYPYYNVEEVIQDDNNN